MKRRLQLGFAVGIALLLMSCKSTKPLTESPENIYIYSFEAAPKTAASASKDMIGRFLGTTAPDRLYKSPENIEYYVSKETVNETFEHDLNTGNFAFRRNMKKYMGDYEPQLPNKEEAATIAGTFLAKQGLTPRRTNEMKIVHYGGLRASSVIDGKRAGPVIDKLVTITYARTVDNLPVLGPGSKMVVDVGEKGEVMGMVYRWRELLPGSRKPVKSREIISLQEAEQLVKKQIIHEYGERATYQIQGSGRAYYDNNGRILQPVYAFETRIVIGPEEKNVKPINYLCIIPMLKRSPEPLNLTALDPKAKKMIGTTDAAEKTIRSRD